MGSRGVSKMLASHDGLCISIGRFDVAIRSTLPHVSRGIDQLYCDFPLSQPGQMVDFRIELAAPSLFRRLFRPQVDFSFDGKRPFKPLPGNQAFAMFEWGLNWVIANHAHEFAIVHAAAVEYEGRGFVFPGAPGSGKSTLCAALLCKGWRLLSDEMALISLSDGLLWPIPRPVSLKNASIDIIRKLSPNVVLGDVVADTLKGNVAHMRPPVESVLAASQPAMPFSVVFPTYRANAETEYSKLSKSATLKRLIENCFNFPVLGGAGFNSLADFVDRAQCRSVVYSDLDDVIHQLQN